MKLSELLERVEKAGPDRDLDRALFIALTGKRVIETRFGPEEEGGQVLRAYTASIDAALALGLRVAEVRPSYLLIGCFQPAEPEATADRIARRCVAALLRALIAKEQAAHPDEGEQ